MLISIYRIIGRGGAVTTGEKNGIKHTFFAISIFFFMETASAREIVLAWGLPPSHPAWSRQQKFMDALAKEAEVRLTLKPIPFNRAEQMLRNGEIDGDVMRIEEVYKETDEVVKVEEPMGYLEMSTISRKSQILEDLEAIQKHGTAADVGSRLQRRVCIKFELNCVFFSPGSQPLEMLRKGRVGTVLADQQQAQDMLKDPKYVEFQLNKKLLYRTPAYLFLRKKDAELAKKLSEALKTIKRKGLYREIFGRDP